MTADVKSGMITEDGGLESAGAAETDVKGTNEAVIAMTGSVRDEGGIG